MARGKAKVSRTMAASILVVALAVLFVAQPGLSRPEQASTASVEAMIKDFQASVEKSIAEAKKTLNMPDKADGAAIVKIIREQSEKTEKAFVDMRAKLDETVKKNPEISGTIDNLKNKIKEAEAKLKKENPEVHANVRKMVDAMQKSYESVGKEMEKINAEVNKKGGVRDDLDNLLKKIIDSGIAGAKELQDRVEEITKKSS